MFFSIFDKENHINILSLWLMKSVFKILWLIFFFFLVNKIGVFVCHQQLSSDKDFNLIGIIVRFLGLLQKLL